MGFVISLFRVLFSSFVLYCLVYVRRPLFLYVFIPFVLSFVM